MQIRPDAATLLDAVATFLMSEVAPKLEGDKALQFRLIIAANLATVVASESRTEDERFADESKRLSRLFPDTAELSSARRQERLAALSTLEAALCARLRAEGPSEAIFEHLFETAKSTLKTTNPRFELSENV